jgi:hypothetical protein
MPADHMGMVPAGNLNPLDTRVRLIPAFTRTQDPPRIGRTVAEY